MTDAGREHHITQALSQYHTQLGGTRDTMRVPLRSTQGMLLEVIEVPLELPVLNAESFRIAPGVAEHPQAELIHRDPNSPDAQRIVAELVRVSHRQADELKESLIDGQDQPGLITRKGKLVNANTRCVLLRELRREGRITTSTIRVAVLPSDVTEPEELELESVLQKQREHKDEYNLVSELMMLKKLHDDAGMSDAAIAKRLRGRNGAQRIADLRAVLELMERARRLTEPPIPLSEFISDQDQRQNWLELLGKVKEIDAREGRSAGDTAIGRWLIAFHLGLSSVHKLRHASGPWIETEVLPDLREGDTIASAIADAASVVLETEEIDTPDPEGISLLGDEPTPPPDADAIAVMQLLDLTIEAKHAGEGDIKLPSGETVPAADVRAVLSGSVSRGLAAAKRRSLAGSRLQRPAYGLNQARSGLKDALDALDEVADQPEFEPLRDNVLMLLEEVAVLLDRVTEALNADESAESISTNA